MPAVHRPTADACPSREPPSAPVVSSGGDASAPACARDADCTDGRGGRCVFRDAPSPQCIYDACAVDADCSRGSACACRASDSDANRCVPAECHTDADCGAEGYCSPTLPRSCAIDGPTGWYCHGPSDACVTDADCQSSGAGTPGQFMAPYCAFDPAAHAWSCVTDAPICMH